jgi:glycerol-3-phosphate dehydrogenase
MKTKGKILYHWPGDGIDESLRFIDSSQLNKDPYEVIIVGAGLVGCALAYKLSQLAIKVLLVEKEFFIAEGTSKANSAMLTTGFDTAVGSLETQLCREASKQWPEICQKLKLPYKQCGCLIAALDDDETAILKDIHKGAMTNGVDDVRLVTESEVQELEPNITSKVLSGVYSPSDAIGDPFGTAFAFAEVALNNGVDILLGSKIVGVESNSGSIKSLITSAGHRLQTRIVVNVSGLGSRELANQYNGEGFDINPRRGQFLVLDKSSGSLVNRTLLPVPNPAKGRGILVIPTIYGGLLAGPTAEDLPYGTLNPTDTTIEVLQSLLPRASILCPDIINQPVIGSFAGARCNCAQGSYIIRFNDGLPGVLTVTGVRSTGFTTSIALADYLIEGLNKKCDLNATNNPEAVDSRPDNAWPGWWKRKFEDDDLINEQSDYGRMVCTCEQISRGEIIEALNSPLKPRTLSAIKRMTIAQLGRCQGFRCLVPIAEIISEQSGISLGKVTLKGPGSEITAA